MISMRALSNLLLLLLGMAILTASLPVATAQSKAAAKDAAKSTPAKAAAVATPPATMSQLMKGILFPSSNVIFAAQNDDPDKVAPAKDPSLATNPLESTYGKWEAVENAALTLAESARLLTVSGRKCSNGRNVPLQNADWAKLVQDLRDAGVTVYKAAQAKDQDKIVDAADVMTTACANCHDKYREVDVRCK